MDQNIRASIQTHTFYYFLIIVFITTVSQISTMLAIIFGDLTGKENLVASLVIASSFIGAFGIIRMMTNLKLIINEMDEVTGGTTYGKEIKSIPFHILRFVFSGIFIIVAVVQLITIYN